MPYNPVLEALVGLGLMCIGGIGSFLAAKYWFWRSFETHDKYKRDAAQEQLVVRVYELERQLSLLGAQVLPLSAAFQAVLVKELTHFHTPEMDALLLKLGPPNIITNEEMEKLIVMLQERERDLGDDISESERDAAHILPIVAKRAKYAMEAISKMNLKVMTVVPEQQQQQQQQQQFVEPVIIRPKN